MTAIDETRATYEPPRPIHLRKARVDHRAVRQAQTMAAFGRHLGPVLARKAAGRTEVPSRVIAHRLRRAFDDLGSTYISWPNLM